MTSYKLYIGMIDYIAASNGGIEMHAEDADGNSIMVGWGNTPEDIAKVLYTNGCYEEVGCSSTIDFSGDYGFEHHGDANKLWGKGIEMVHSIEDREVASRKIANQAEARYQVATNYFDAQGAWAREAFQILKGAGYNPDAINKALADWFDNGKGEINRFHAIVREMDCDLSMPVGE